MPLGKVVVQQTKDLGISGQAQNTAMEECWERDFLIYRKNLLA